MDLKSKPEDQWSCNRSPDYWVGINMTMEKLPQQPELFPNQNKKKTQFM